MGSSSKGGGLLQNADFETTLFMDGPYPPVDLYLNIEKSKWKIQVWQTEFLACKNQFRNWFL